MKDALGHGSDPRGVSGGNVSPKEAASAMHSDHVVGGAHDSTYPGAAPHGHEAYAAEGVGDLVHRPINTSDPHEFQRQLQENIARFTAKYGGPRNHAAEQRGFNRGAREIARLKKQGK